MGIGQDISTAAAILRNGGLVAFPTETVYGLGARADSGAAVRRIFEVKARPSTHPLIVHIADSQQLEFWAVHVSTDAWKLANAFWPGPLTLIFKRQPEVPLEVTGGLGTVAVRVPNHPVALQLLREVGVGVAAPSANRFSEVSPTCSEHVENDLGDRVDYILEGGSSVVGIESTILDVSGSAPVMLRPGGVSKEAIEATLGYEIVLLEKSETRAPGQHALHYAPRAEVKLIAPGNLRTEALLQVALGRRVGILAHGLSVEELPPMVFVHTVAGDPDDLARELYAALRSLDASGVDLIIASLPEPAGIGLAIADRLTKAAGPRS